MANAKSPFLRIVAISTTILDLLAFGPLGVAGQHSAAVSRSFSSSQANIGYGYAQAYYGGYGGAYVPYYGTAYYTPGYSYAPPYWWAGPYASTDPGGTTYNPNAGYAWGSVSVLLLETTPAKASVTLDGILVGTMDCLGPFQLPMGE